MESICKEGGLRIKKIFKNNAKVPLVSIITVIFNGQKYIEQTILSVLNQTYSNIEYIIIDGNSNDATLDIVKRYDDKIDYWISEPDNGIYDAMNKGISLATGDIIGIINSDDWYEPYCVEEVMQVFMQHKDSIIYGLMRHISNECPIEIYAAYPLLIPKKTLPHSTCFVPKHIYIEKGAFNLKYKSCADYHFILRMYQSGVLFVLIEKVLANFRFGGFSWNFNSLKESFNMRYEMGYISNFQRIMKIVGLFFMSQLKK